MEVRNRFKGLDLIDRVPDELWMEVRDIVQETGIKTIPMEKKCKKAKWLSEEPLQIAVKRREAKSRGVSVTALVITGIALLTRWQILQVFLDVNEAGGWEALEIAVRYLTLMAPCFIIVHLLHVFRNVLQAMGIAVWALASGVAEFAARVFMSRIAIHWIGADALFIAEPASWLGAMLCVFLPYFYYRKKYLEGTSARGD